MSCLSPLAGCLTEGPIAAEAVVLLVAGLTGSSFMPLPKRPEKLEERRKRKQTSIDRSSNFSRAKTSLRGILTTQKFALNPLSNHSVCQWQVRPKCSSEQSMWVASLHWTYATKISRPTSLLSRATRLVVLFADAVHWFVSLCLSSTVSIRKERKCSDGRRFRGGEVNWLAAIESNHAEISQSYKQVYWNMYRTNGDRKKRISLSLSPAHGTHKFQTDVRFWSNSWAFIEVIIVDEPCICSSFDARRASCRCTASSSSNRRCL